MRLTRLQKSHVDRPKVEVVVNHVLHNRRIDAAESSASSTQMPTNLTASQRLHRPAHRPRQTGSTGYLPPAWRVKNDDRKVHGPLRTAGHDEVLEAPSQQRSVSGTAQHTCRQAGAKISPRQLPNATPPVGTGMRAATLTEGVRARPPTAVVEM